jgi:Malectin domain
VQEVINPVSIATVLNGAEPNRNGQFVVSLSQVAAIDTVITYHVAGTAAEDTATVLGDYTALPRTVTIPAGQLSAPIEVAVIDDLALEGDETVIVTLTGVSGDPSIVLGGSNQATMNIADNGSMVRYRVNAGGPEIAAIDGGPNWLTDTAFLLDAGSNTVAGFPAIQPGIRVPLNVPKEIFDTERFDRISATEDTEMQYRFAVDPGLYEVRLYMGNGYQGTRSAGARVFDVAIEGKILSNLNDIDLSRKFGNAVGSMISNIVMVTDSNLDIKFLHGVENPLVNGIEIIQIGDVMPPAPLQPISQTLSPIDRLTGLTSSDAALSLGALIDSPNSINVAETFAETSVGTSIDKLVVPDMTLLGTIATVDQTVGISGQMLGQDFLATGGENAIVGFTNSYSFL